MNFKHYIESDIQKIQLLFASAFADSEGEAEGAIIGKLSKDLLETTEKKDLYVFVASKGNDICGSIIVTRMPSEIEDKIFLLGPVAVAPQSQGQGIGQKLIRYGINELKRTGAKILVTYGDPKFYSKVGFSAVSDEVIEPPYPLSQPHGWLAQNLSGEQITEHLGKCSCVPAFAKPSFW